jgi:uncharacterized 2Fe-2S/4Fe-4S cluster protein (DUF4445 family)
MGYLYINENETKYYFEEAHTLLEIIKENNLILESPCAGKGTCGKCKIKILSGKINSIGEEEMSFLTEEEILKGIRLSCFAIPIGEVTVEFLKSENSSRSHRILKEGYMPNLELTPSLHKKVYEVNSSVDSINSIEELIEITIGQPLNKNHKWNLNSFSDLLHNEKFTVTFMNDEILGVEMGDTKDKLYSLAIDIGTTTVVVSLVDINSGKEIDCDSEINPQKEYGLDVLSRIAFIKNSVSGLNVLHNSIIQCINRLTSSLCIKNNIHKHNIYEVAVAANTTMQHILLGVNPTSIGKSPYMPVFTGSKNILASDLGVQISPFGMIYVLPGVSGYIGADIVAGVIVSKLHNSDKNILLIDIGTNGEIVLSKKGELTSCSCAAGPALEGMNISCGMRAATGAIEKIQIESSGINIKVIDDVAPIGICGSGIIDGVSEIVKNNIVSCNGRIKKKSDLEKDDVLKKFRDFIKEDGNKRKVLICPGNNDIEITQEDIRQVQLAKGAILSGFYTLLDSMELTVDDLDEIIIAGQFGKHLSVDSLVGVGIVPRTLKNKIRYIGNSSKTGAVMTLLSKEVREEIEGIAKSIDYFELSSKPNYERLFIKCLNFDHI